MLFVHGGKCFSRKAVLSWAEKFSQGYPNVADNETEVRKWLRQQSKDFYAVGIDALVKPLDKYINVGRGYVDK
jgi:thiamine kinase-like enzyme